MQYDLAAKAVLEHGKEAIIRCFLGLPLEEAELIEELPQETVSLRRSDFPMRIRLKSGEERILILEFQTRWESDIPLRLLDYTVRFKLKYHLPVWSAVLVFRKGGGISEVYENDVIRFSYKVVKLWEIKAREILREGEIWVYPFIPVMDCSEKEIFEAERRIYESELSGGEKADLLSALAIFAGLKDEDIATKLLKRRRDIMIESPTYRLIKEEGIREGMLEEAKEMVLEALSTRFGVLPLDLAQKVKSIQLREVLRQLLRVAVTVESLDEFEEQLKKAIGERRG